MKKCRQCKKTFSPVRKEQMFCSKACASVRKGMMRKGQKTGPQKSRQYKKRLNRDGYLMMYAGNHPYANGRLMVAEHVMAMELAIGRRIAKNECVHHVNGVKTDNRIANLKLMKFSDHSTEHATEQAKRRKRNARGRFA